MSRVRRLARELSESMMSDFWKKWMGPESVKHNTDQASANQQKVPAHTTTTNPPPQISTTPKPQHWTSAGCVIVPSLHPDDLNYVYVIKPSNNYGPWSFPKGRIDAGESPQETARREVGEETGIHVALLPGGYLGKGEGRFSTTHFFMAVQAGGDPGQHDHEVEKVKLVTFEDAWKLFAMGHNKRDLMILQRAWKFLSKFRKRAEKVRAAGRSLPAVGKVKAAKMGYSTGVTNAKAVFVPSFPSLLPGPVKP